MVIGFSGLLIFPLLYCLIIILAISGAINLIISMFLIKRRKAFGKVLFTIGFMCVFPFLWLNITEIKRTKQKWDRLGPLIQAIEKQDYKKAGKCIQEGHNVNEINEYAYPDTPLKYAIKKNDIEMVKLLVENGADVNLGKDSEALRTAIGEKNVTIVGYLLEKGADVIVKNREHPDYHPIKYAERIEAGDEIISSLKEYVKPHEQHLND